MPKHSLNNEDLFNLIVQKCYRFLSIRNRTEKEIEDYLNKKVQRYKISNQKELIRKIIQRLKEENFINDEKFIEWWVEQRSYFKPKGIFVLRRELLNKGIVKELIDDFFEKNGTDEFKLAKNAILKKEKFFKKIDEKERYKKTIDFLIRRGFSYTLAKKAFAECFKKG